MTTGDHTHHHHDQPTAAQRLADALGWQHLPVLTDAEEQQLTAELNAAQAAARRIYGLTHPSNTPVAEPPPQQPIPPIQSTDELIQPGMFDTDQELDEFLADLHATRRTSALTTLTMTFVEIRNDVAWLKQAARALLHHYDISLDRTCQPDQIEDSPPAT